MKRVTDSSEMLPLFSHAHCRSLDRMMAVNYTMQQVLKTNEEIAKLCQDVAQNWFRLVLGIFYTQ